MAKKIRGIDVSGASSITLLIHGVGDHSGANIIECARQGFENSPLAEDFTCVIEPCHLKRKPWLIDNKLKLTRGDETHYVVPCIWSGTRIGRHLSVLMIVIAIMIGALLIAVVSTIYLLDWLEVRTFVAMGVGALVLDGLAFLGRDKNDKAGLPLLPVTSLAICFIIAVQIIRVAYPWLWLLPALIMAALGVAFAIPTLHCVRLARNFVWRALILSATSGVFVLLTVVGLLIGDMLRTAVPSSFQGLDNRMAIMLLVMPVVLFIVLGILFLITRALSPIELVLDVTRYVGSSSSRDKLLESFRNLVDSLARQSPESPIRIVSHSLGTVAAAQGCLEAMPYRWALITMGSPLAIVSEVFPNVVLSPQQLQSSFLESENFEFWLNLWRNSDPIGRALSVDKTRFSEHSIGNGGHSNYWNDKLVWEAILTAIRGEAPQSESVRGPQSLLSKHGQVLLGVGALLVWALALTGALFVNFTPQPSPEMQPLINDAVVEIHPHNGISQTIVEMRSADDLFDNASFLHTR